ncbi:MAG: ATP-binding protein [Bacteroidaceae bacterium]|nr:ATP-binding protein [Bacteroidaceae bacterium]
MQKLYLTYSRLLSSVDNSYHRYLYDKINWDNRLIAIKGPKGVGKTTLVLQHIKDTFKDVTKALYVSMDNIWFKSHTVSELVEYHYSHGGTHIFIDEVHKYNDWAQEIKNVYDSYPDFHIVVTGSSLLQLEDAMEHDLSRRCRMYDLQGLSFREFVRLETGKEFNVYNIEQVVKSHFEIATEITSKVKILPLFEKYVRNGYYPFYREEGDGYWDRLQFVVRTIVENDIPSVDKIEYESLYKAERFLSILSEMVPFTLNIASLTSTLGLSRNSLLKIFDLLDRAKLIRLMYTCKVGMKQLAKPEKILFDNSNLLFALTSNVDSGTVRECFFCNQVGQLYNTVIPKTGDCLVNDKYLFEIGGKKKSFKQVKEIPDSYVVADDIEVGMGNRIPLWLFGFMY